MPVSEATKKRWAESFKDPNHMAGIISQLEARKKDPYAFSSLKYWLALETWTRDEGLFLLAGLDPATVEADLLNTDISQFVDALPLDQHEAFLLDPVDKCSRDEWPGSAESYESYLQAAEKKEAILNSHRRLLHTLDHVLARSVVGLGERVGGLPVTYRPTQFLAWANTIKFVPAWRDWAVANALLPDGESAFVAPFFDADAPEYPEYLAIAVRAWTHAKNTIGGTPKQRILAYLSARYPNLKDGPKEAIAAVANWEKRGGRPKTGG